MKRIIHIVIIILFFALRAVGQDGRGDVVIHSDPRLSVLMKKKKAVTASLTKPPVHHATTDGKIIAGTLPAHSATDAATVTGAASTTHPVVAAPAAGAPPTNVPPVNVPATVTPPEAVAKPEPDVPVAKMPAPVYVREKEGRVIYSGKGYRVLIYNGPDREKAIQVKTEFMRNFPGIRTYVSYVSPGYRVKVGNYRHREEALGMYKEAKDIYGPCVIVPDMITINTH